MTREQQRSKDAGPQESPLIVTSAEFAAADFEAPIGDSSNVDCWTLGSLYQTAASEAEESGDGSALRVFALLDGLSIENVGIARWWLPLGRAWEVTVSGNATARGRSVRTASDIVLDERRGAPARA